MIAAGTDWTAVAAVVVPVAVSILGGGLAMAWRLGSLERTVKDGSDDVARLERRLTAVENRLGGMPWGRRVSDRE